MVGRAANTGVRGWRALGIRVLATSTLSYAVLDAMRQLPALEDVAGSGGASGSGEAGAGHETSAHDAEGGHHGACCAHHAAHHGETPFSNYGSPWVAGVVDKAVSYTLGGRWEGLGDWPSAELGAVQFWGLASLLGYLAFAEALPLLLRPLHGFVRWASVAGGGVPTSGLVPPWSMEAPSHGMQGDELWSPLLTVDPYPLCACSWRR